MLECKNCDNASSLDRSECQKCLDTAEEEIKKNFLTK